MSEQAILDLKDAVARLERASNRIDSYSNRLPDDPPANGAALVNSIAGVLERAAAELDRVLTAAGL